MKSIEIESVDELQAHIASGRSMANVVVQGLDLRDQEALLESTDLQGAVFLGSQLTPQSYATACGQGAVVFRPPVDTPFSPYRNSLYTPDELFDGFDADDPATYDQTLDERVYQYTRRPGIADDILQSLACRLHDHAITDALHEAIEGHDVVAIMGGHSLSRGDLVYHQVAAAAKSLAESGVLLTSGGGPGAMEATHLGAWMAHRADNELQEAVGMLAAAPGFEERERWLATALDVKAAYPRRPDAAGRLVDSVGIPTWLYGHEPPTVFATRIAKYFANSVREEGLLAIATSGVVFAPGSAGTIQEIFQDAAQNHYRSYGHPAPMVFLGVDYWTNQKPVYPLLEELSAGHDYGELLAITDDSDAAVAAILEFIAKADQSRNSHSS